MGYAWRRPPEHHSAVRAFGPAAVDVLPRAIRRVGREFAPDAIDRRAVPTHALLRIARPDAMALSARVRRESQACASADARDGAGGDLSPAADQRTGARTSHLPVFIAKCGHRTARPGVERRHHLRAAASGLHVPGGGARL